jgi:pyridoxine 5-phosphate synthase
MQPRVVTLVPERREERTTEGGLDVIASQEFLARAVWKLTSAGIRVSMFIAADERQTRASKEIGAVQVEFHTGEYALATTPDAQRKELSRIATASKLAASLNLEVAAGHGLTRENVVELVAIPEIAELNVGHAVIADAVFMSLPGAVHGLRAAIDFGRRREG